MECGSFVSSGSLEATVANRLRGATVLVGAHGAGLANLVFMPPHSLVFELDSVEHAIFSRPFLQQLAVAVGLRPEKVW